MWKKEDHVSTGWFTCILFKHISDRPSLPDCAGSGSPHRFQTESQGKGQGKSWERNGGSQSLICQYHCPYRLGMEGPRTCHLEDEEGKNTKVRKISISSFEDIHFSFLFLLHQDTLFLACDCYRYILLTS